MTEYETPPLQTAVDTEQIKNVQYSERDAIHVSGTKKWLTLPEYSNSAELLQYII